MIPVEERTMRRGFFAGFNSLSVDMMLLTPFVQIVMSDML